MQHKSLNYPILKYPSSEQFQQQLNLKQSAKQNLLSLSNNDNESLLVSSMRVSSDKQNGYSHYDLNLQEKIKKQNKFNSQIKQNNLNNQNDKVIKYKMNNIMMIKSRDVNNDMTFSCLQSKNQKSNCVNYQCESKKCFDKINQLESKLKTNQKRLEEVQSMIKILFSNKVYTQSLLNQHQKQCQTLNYKLEQESKQIKKIVQNQIKQETNQNIKISDLTQKINKLNQKVINKKQQQNQLIELQFISLQQKIQKINVFYEGKVNSIIEMIEDVANLQRKMQEEKQSIILSPVENIMLSYPRSKNTFQLKNNQSRYHKNDRLSEKQRNKKDSKSKISYYLSKSNFHEQNTTLGDFQLNNMSRIN